MDLREYNQTTCLGNLLKGQWFLLKGDLYEVILIRFDKDPRIPSQLCVKQLTIQDRKLKIPEFKDLDAFTKVIKIYEIGSN